MAIIYILINKLESNNNIILDDEMILVIFNLSSI